MPLVKRCVCCGRLADIPHNAMPYKKGVCCQECYVKVVKPSMEWKWGKYAKR